MNFKNIIIALFFFLIFLFLIYLLYKLYFHKLKIEEGLENKYKNEEIMKQEENNDNDLKSKKSDELKSNNYKHNDKLFNNEQDDVNIPIGNCISGCVVSYDDCSQSTENVNEDNQFKCSWSNIFKFSTSNPNNDYNQYCSKCEIIDNVKYIQNKTTDKDAIGSTKLNNDSKNFYQFEFKGKKIQLHEGDYMDKNGNVKKMQKQKAIPPLKTNQNLPTNELDMLSGNGDDKKSNNNNPNSIDNIENTQNKNSTQNNSEIQKQIKNHIISSFDTYIDKLVNCKNSERNVGSNLNTSAHDNIGFMNLNSKLSNLITSNFISNNRLIQDSLYTGQQMCHNATTGQEIRCPTSYDYKPSMSIN